MFKQFYDDLTYLPRRKFNAKYTLPVLIWFLGCVLVGQLIMIFVPVSQLNKVSGRIVSMGNVIDSWSHNRFSRDSPNYALAITLDNGISYNVQDEHTQAKLGSVLKIGDNVVIYYPTTAVWILSANMARKVSQVERGSEVLYSWNEQQNGEWFIVALLIIVMGMFYWMKGYLRDYIETSRL